MDVNYTFGVIFLVLGFINLIIYIAFFLDIKLPFFTFWKLEPMQKMFGRKAGFIVHFFAYVIVPIFTGLYLLKNS